MITWINSWTRRIPVAQLCRYAAVGLFSNLIGYGLYWLLTFWGASPKLTMTALYIAGAVISFSGNRRITFSYKGGGLSSGLRFLCVHAGGYLINLALLYTLTDRLGFSHLWVQAGAILVVAAYLFIALKFYVFKATP